MPLTSFGIAPLVQVRIKQSSAFVLALLLAACNRPEAAADRSTPDPPALTVAVAPVTGQVLQESVLATGTVTAWRELSIGAEATGLAVVDIAVDEGVAVKQGDLLVQLSDVVLKAEIQQQQATIREVRATFDAAQKTQQRAQQLVGSSAISQQTIDDRNTSVRTAEAKMLAGEAALVQLEAQLARTRVTAPADGIISKRAVTLGQVVQTGTELFRIIQDNRLEVDAKVSEADLFTLRAGQLARVTDPTGQQTEARIREIAPVVDSASRLGTVHIALPSGTALKPGMFARVEIVADAKPALVVPRQALVWRAGAPGVFVVDENDAVALRNVATGRQFDEHVEVNSGLETGERIVTLGAGFLTDGDRVNVASVAADQEAGR